MHATSHEHENRSVYVRFAAMIALSFIAMYVLMYAMVDTIGNVYGNLDQVYMAALMTTPMAVIELVLMAGMYPDRRLNMAIVAACVVLGALSWFAIRSQAGVSDRQFVRAMIPHHAGAILMCRKSALSDPDLRRLCGEIIESQQREIDAMKAELR